MNINVHAGHNPDGKPGSGAVGLIRESTEARKVKDEVISRLRRLGHTVYDCTCENGSGQRDVLKKIVDACNAHQADLDVAIHFNSGAGDSAGNGKTTGTEAYVYRMTGPAAEYARRVCEAVSRLGYVNRGVKANQGLYVLKNTKAPAMLVECCFVDDRDDVNLYRAEDMAEAIVSGITGISDPPDTGDPEGTLYRVQTGAFAIRENAVAMQARLKAAGFDAIIVRGRQG